MTQLLVVVMTVVMQSQKSTPKCLTSYPRPPSQGIIVVWKHRIIYSLAADLNTSHWSIHQ